MKQINLLMILIMTSFMVFVHGSYNIVFIMADDLDLVLDGMTPLNNTLHLIGEKGVTFQNCFVASPICCPNRASILTGRYQHNHLTVNNTINGGCNSAQWQQIQEPNTFAAYLHKQMGYNTFYAGKYLNQYGNKDAGGVSHVPEGWDWWAGLVGNSQYYSYSLSINGTERKYGMNPGDYLTDVISEMATDFINSRKGNANPFLMVLAPPAPHAPFQPAARHNDRFRNVPAKKTPNFNTPPVSNKHWLVRMGPSPLPNETLSHLDDVYRRRWETLLAVDDMVLAVHQALKNNDLLKDTYIIFTSDNGYHIGQFSMPLDKRQPYETDIRVPLLIRGPGLSPAKVASPVSSVDIFATILNIAGVEAKSDGVSLLNSNLAIDRTLLVEYRGERSEGNRPSGCPSDADPNLCYCSKTQACKCQDAANNTYSCIRRVSPEHNNMFCVFEDGQGYIEAYDLNVDVYQMNNIGYSMKRSHRYRFRKHLKKMSTCKDEQCIVIGH